MKKGHNGGTSTNSGERWKCLFSLGSDWVPLPIVTPCQAPAVLESRPPEATSTGPWLLTLVDRSFGGTGKGSSTTNEKEKLSLFCQWLLDLHFGGIRMGSSDGIDGITGPLYCHGMRASCSVLRSEKKEDEREEKKRGREGGE